MLPILPALTPAQVQLAIAGLIDYQTLNYSLAGDDQSNYRVTKTPNGFIWTIGNTSVFESSGGSGSSVNFEKGSFNRSTAGVENVVTLKKAKLIFFIATDLATFSSASQGQSSGTNPADNYCIHNKLDGNAFVNNPAQCILMVDGVSTLGASVTAINPTSFDLTFTSAGGGINANVNWFAITE